MLYIQEVLWYDGTNDDKGDTMKITVIHPRNGEVLDRAFGWAMDASASSPENFGKRFNNFKREGKVLTFETHDVHVHLRAGEIGEFERDFTARDGAFYVLMDSMVNRLNNQPISGRVIIDGWEYSDAQAVLHALNNAKD